MDNNTARAIALVMFVFIVFVVVVVAGIFSLSIQSDSTALAFNILVASVASLLIIKLMGF